MTNPSAAFLASCSRQVLGVQSDVLFPVTQQRELEHLLREAGGCGATAWREVNTTSLTAVTSVPGFLSRMRSQRNGVFGSLGRKRGD